MLLCRDGCDSAEGSAGGPVGIPPGALPISLSSDDRYINPGSLFSVVYCESVHTSRCANHNLVSLASSYFGDLGDGNDWLALYHHPSASVVDQVGQPGTFMEVQGWDVAGVMEATRDHRLTRKCGISHGSCGDWALSAGTDPGSSQWEVWTSSRASPPSSRSLPHPRPPMDGIRSR